MTERDMFGARIGEYEVPGSESIITVNCRSCGATMVWTRTAKGKPIPLSVTTIETRDGVRFALPHFVDCPDAKKWSKA